MQRRNQVSTRDLVSNIVWGRSLVSSSLDLLGPIVEALPENSAVAPSRLKRAAIDMSIALTVSFAEEVSFTECG
jgi:hypothetical protein